VQLFASVATEEIKADQPGALHSHITMEIIGNSIFVPVIDNLTHIE
jgi:hypothetical protein